MTALIRSRSAFFDPVHGESQPDSELLAPRPESASENLRCLASIQTKLRLGGCPANGTAYRCFLLRCHPIPEMREGRNTATATVTLQETYAHRNQLLRQSPILELLNLGGTLVRSLPYRFATRGIHDPGRSPTL